MEQINVNVENLTEEERELLLNLIKKGNKKVDERWRADNNESYYAIFSNGGIYPVKEYHTDENYYMYNSGNYFKTMQEAIFKKEKYLTYQQLKDYALKHNKSEIDWNNNKQAKYYISYSAKKKMIGYGCAYSDMSLIQLGQIYFTSRDLAKDAVKAVGEDRVKKYLFGVKD